jgi:hypothetical protein
MVWRHIYFTVRVTSPVFSYHGRMIDIYYSNDGWDLMAVPAVTAR